MKSLKGLVMLFLFPMVALFAFSTVVAEKACYTLAKVGKYCGDGLAKFHAEMADGYCSRSELGGAIQNLMKESNGYRQTKTREDSHSDEVGWSSAKV